MGEGGGAVVVVGVVAGAWYAATGAGVELVVDDGGGRDEVLVVEGIATGFGACWLSACFCATGAASGTTAAGVGGVCPGVTQTVVVASTVLTNFSTTVSTTISFLSKGKAETRARMEANAPMLKDFIFLKIVCKECCGIEIRIQSMDVCV